MDIHCNFREPGYEYKDDLKSGIQSAAKEDIHLFYLCTQTKPVIDSKSHVEFIKNNTIGKYNRCTHLRKYNKKLRGEMI